MDRRDLDVCYEQLGFTEAPFQMTPDTDYFFPHAAAPASIESICNSGSPVVS